MGLKAIGVLYTVLTCWPEVLPNADVHKGIVHGTIQLYKTIIYILSRETVINFDTSLKQ